MDYLDHLVLVVFLVSQDLQVLLEILGKLVPLDLQEDQVQLARQDLGEM